MTVERAATRLLMIRRDQLGLSTSHTCCDCSSGGVLVLRNPIKNTLDAPSGGVCLKSNSVAPETVSVTANVACSEGTVSHLLPIPKSTSLATSVASRDKLAGDIG